MGRADPSHAPLAQQSFRKDQRAKNARATINKTIPQVLASDARARKGTELAYLFTAADFEADSRRHQDGQNATAGDPSKKKSGKARRQDARMSDDCQPKSFEEPTKVEDQPCKISIHASDTLIAARDLNHRVRSKRNIAILNMASPLRPGGGVLNGATSQEESLCARTTLLPSLKEEWYRLPEIGGIWSPDVLVFKLPGVGDDEVIPKQTRFYVDVVSAAMTRFPDTVERAAQTNSTTDQAAEGGEGATEKVYARQKDRDIALEKMRTVLRMLKVQKTEYVVLGAWGCGAYGNPTGEIATAWKRALLGTRSGGANGRGRPTGLGSIKEVVFAIKNAGMARDFARYWGDGMVITEPKKLRRSPANADVHEQQTEELAEKINALELQITQAQTPILKQGLQSTLEILQTQLEQLKEPSSDME